MTAKLQCSRVQHNTMVYSKAITPVNKHLLLHIHVWSIAPVQHSTSCHWSYYSPKRIWQISFKSQNTGKYLLSHQFIKLRISIWFVKLTSTSVDYRVHIICFSLEYPSWCLPVAHVWLTAYGINICLKNDQVRYQNSIIITNGINKHIWSDITYISEGTKGIWNVTRKNSNSCLSISQSQF